ncbi:asparaginase [Marinilabiliaceae bacterium JC040]|nr:asparaginase [Marinilabiliaceae bacterium JC040]
MENKGVLIIYTGGTIGMMNDPITGSLCPFSFEEIAKEVPEINEFDFPIETLIFENLIDSSNIKPTVWIKLCEIIKEKYNQYDGFVILHGTDTMAYTASALSFMIDGLNKPIVLTGSQLPIGKIRTDGKENLITAIEIAGSKENNQAIVPEVCLYFGEKLYRGNRTTKFTAEHFNAFSSHNYPYLAKVGIHIHYNKAAIKDINVKNDKISICTNFNTNIAILKIFPGINESQVDAIIGIKDLKAIIIETYGAGNAPTEQWFIDKMKEAISKGIIVYNVTQCQAGRVDMGRYETSLELLNIGVMSGFDTTIEAAVTKLMFLLGKYNKIEDIKKDLKVSLKGEISHCNSNF